MAIQRTSFNVPCMREPEPFIIPKPVLGGDQNPGKVLSGRLCLPERNGLPAVPADVGTRSYPEHASLYQNAGKGGQKQICALREPQSRRSGSTPPRTVQWGRHEQLRRLTTDPHRSLEAALKKAGYFASGTGYRRYLGSVAPLYAALEAALERAGASRLMPDWPRRRKSDLILAELGAQPEASGRGDGTTGCLSAAVALRLDQPSDWGAGDVFGTLYVLEGATLGGAVLAQQMRLRGATGWEARSLLDPYGVERGAMWRFFLERLESAALTLADEAALYSRAGATFTLFSVATAEPVSAESAQ